MTKLHTATAKQLVVLLKFLIDGGGLPDGAAICRHVRLHLGRPRTDEDVNVYQLAGMFQPDIAQAYQDLSIATIRREPPGGNLIEEIAQLVAGDFARNRLSGATLRNLRNLLLLPNELAASAGLGDTPIICHICDRVITGGEACSISDNAIVCAGCQPIMYNRCHSEGCQNVVPISGALRQQMTRSRCEDHQQQRATTAPTAAAPTPSGLGNLAGTFGIRSEPITYEVASPEIGRNLSEDIWRDLHAAPASRVDTGRHVIMTTPMTPPGRRNR